MENCKTKNKIALVEDHLFLRMSLLRLIEDYEEFEVVAESGNGYEAFDMIAELKPDIALLDISMPGMNGLELTRKINAKKLQTKCIIVTAHDKKPFVNSALEAGAIGYLLKECLAEDLIKAMKCAQQGKTFVSNPKSNQ